MFVSYMLWCLFLYIFASWLLYPGPQECKSLIKLVREKIVQINKEKKATQKILKGHIAELLEKGLDVEAYQRAKTLHIELTKSSYYVLVDKSCDFVSKNLPLPQELSECSVEYREAISSLMFGAELFTLPELHNLRQILRDRYGSSVEVVKQEVNAFLNTNSPTSGKRVRLMREIASEFKISWDSEAFEPRMSKSSALAQDPNAFNHKHSKSESPHYDASGEQTQSAHYDASGEEYRVVRKSRSSCQQETGNLKELLIKLAKVTIIPMNRKATETLRILIVDIVKLLRKGLDVDACQRAERLLFESKLSSYYGFLEKSCKVVFMNLPLPQELSECSVEYREAISSLMFAGGISSRPELRNIRQIFQDRYRSSPELYVNQEFPAFVNSHLPTLRNKVRWMRCIASNFSIKWDSKAFESRMLNSSALAQDPNALNHSTKKAVFVDRDNNIEQELKGIRYASMRKENHQKKLSNHKDAKDVRVVEENTTWNKHSKSESAQESSGGKRFGEGWRQDESNARLILYDDAMRKAAKIKPKVPLDRSNEPRPNHVHPNQPEYHELPARVVRFTMEDHLMPKHH